MGLTTTLRTQLDILRIIKGYVTGRMLGSTLPPWKSQSD